MNKKNSLNITMELSQGGLFKNHINGIRCKHPPLLAVLDKMSYVFFMLLNEDKSST